MRAHGHYNAETCHQRDRRGTTVTHQRQRHTYHRQYATDHGNVDEQIDEKCHNQRACDQPAKSTACLRG